MFGIFKKASLINGLAALKSVCLKLSAAAVALVCSVLPTVLQVLDTVLDGLTDAEAEVPGLHVPGAGGMLR